jgi:drug/metabolite transporter (DMT)-like permease
VFEWAWTIFTVFAAAGQTARNAMQRELTATLGTVGATHVRFLYGLPFGLVFCLVVLTVSGARLPTLTPTMLGWTFVGAMTQIVATALLLTAMREKSFVVVTALSKTEPIHVAVFGLVVLGDQVTWPLGLAILIATVGVLVMSWPKTQEDALSLRPILIGLVSASVFAMSAIGFRRAILTLDGANFVVNASTTLAIGLAMQVAVLSAYLVIRERDTLVALFRAWRPSIKAGFAGAFASQMWFLAFAVESAAKVRTLALIEILFAQIISRSIFKTSLASRDGVGIGLIVIGVVILLNL